MEAKHPISTYVAGDGTTYLRTQYGRDAQEIADALKPYVGRDMHGDVPNMYGHYKRYPLTLTAVEGDQVTIHVRRFDHTATLSAFDVFGSHCTVIEKE